MGEIQEKTRVESQLEAEGEGRDQEWWWTITIAPNKGFFPGWLGWLLRKIGLRKQKEYPYEDSIKVTTEGDTTTIRPKE